jgi:hypothetical protein
VSGVRASWSDDRGAELADGVGALAPRVAFVADDGFAAVEAAGQQWQRDLAFGAVGSNECGRLGGAVEGADEVRPHPPEPAGVTLAVAVAAHLGQIGAAGRLERAAALDRRRVEQDEIVVEAGRLGRDHPAQPLDRFGQSRAALMQRILAGQLGEQVPQLPAGCSQEPAIAWDPHQ